MEIKLPEDYKRFEPGDRVRSFDFGTFGTIDARLLTGERAAYAEGVVDRFEHHEGCERAVIRVTKRVFGGVSEDEFASEVMPPLNGIPTSLGASTQSLERIDPKLDTEQIETERLYRQYPEGGWIHVAAENNLSLLMTIKMKEA
jgi:hypothetical protein